MLNIVHHNEFEVYHHKAQNTLMYDRLRHRLLKQLSIFLLNGAVYGHVPSVCFGLKMQQWTTTYTSIGKNCIYMKNKALIDILYITKTLYIHKFKHIRYIY